MSFKRFVAATARDAMVMVRRELGDDAVILSNKRIGANRVEILAAAEQAVDQIVEQVSRDRAVTQGVTRASAPSPAVESFHDYLRRQGPAKPGNATGRHTTPAASLARPATVNAISAPVTPVARSAASAPRPQTIARPTVLPAQPKNSASSFKPAPSAALYDAVALTEEDEPQTLQPQVLPLPRAAAHAGRIQPQAALNHDELNEAQYAQYDDWDNTLPLTAANPMAPHWDMPAQPPALRQPAPSPAVFRRRPSRVEALEAQHVAAQQAAAQQAAAQQAATQQVAAQQQAMAQQQLAAQQVAVQRPALAAQPAVPQAAPAARADQPAIAAPAVSTTTANAAAAHPATEMRLPPRSEGDTRLMNELVSLRAALQEQLAAISTTVAAGEASRRSPVQTRLMTRLLTAGFSVDVARRIALHAPQDAEPAEADAWLQEVLSTNLRCTPEMDSIVESGGVFAMVGPTGVGKTTTIAKLAARFAVKYGAAGLGLITLDGYRVGAQEQLRTYGRILGVPVGLAQDESTLREVLLSMRNKRLVLIDTCGLGQRDQRLQEMLTMLAHAGSSLGLHPVKPVLLLNAASHAETLDETARAWNATQVAGTILTKIDEAARIGGALDCLLRHKLRLFGLTNGQRVPEDWHLPKAQLLAHLALKPAGQLFALADAEGALMGQQNSGQQKTSQPKAAQKPVAQQSAAATKNAASTQATGSRAHTVAASR